MYNIFKCVHHVVSLTLSVKNIISKSNEVLRIYKNIELVYHVIYFQYTYHNILNELKYLYPGTS